MNHTSKPLRTWKGMLIVLVVLALAACAQVPKESVELSTTVGRDVTTVYKSHRELAKLLFGRMRQDVNRFVDNVYAPYQIRAAIENDYKNSRSNDAKDRSASLLLAINNAFKPDASGGLQKNVIDAMGFMVGAIRDDVESMRKELLEPINVQETALLAVIDRNYGQIIYANSIVIGHLASIVKVNDAQSELLKSLGLDADLGKMLGEKLANTSEKIGALVTKAESTDEKLNKVTTNLDHLKNLISGK